YTALFRSGTGGTNREIGDRRPEPAELGAQGVLPLGAPHALEHAVARVLDRHVDVRHDARLPRHQRQQPLAEPRRVDVQQAVPRNRRLADQRFQTMGTLRATTPQITPVIPSVRSDSMPTTAPP